MKILYKRRFNYRVFVSVGLFFSLIILFITAIVIQIFEALDENLFIHLFTVIHIFTGFAFTTLAGFHTIRNWESMKVYVKDHKTPISREVIYALILTITTIFSALLFVCFVMD